MPTISGRQQSMCVVAGFGHGKGMAALAHMIFVN